MPDPSAILVADARWRGALARALERLESALASDDYLERSLAARELGRVALALGELYGDAHEARRRLEGVADGA